MDARARDYRKPRTKFARVMRIVVRVVVGLIVFVLALPPLALVALRFSGPRAFVAGKLDTALATLFRGRVHFAKLERFDLGGARLSGSIDDGAGHKVVRFQNLAVDLNVPSLVWRVLRDGGSPSVITLDALELEHADVWLLDDGTGSPTLAHTFDPRKPSPPGTPSSPTPTVTVRRIALRHVWVHGALASSPLIDADLSDVRGKLGLDAQKFAVELANTRLAARMAPNALDPRGTLKAGLRLPMGTGAMSANATFDGSVAEAELHANAALDGTKVDAKVLLPSVDTRVVKHFAPDLAVRGPLAVTATAGGTTDNLALVLDARGGVGTITAHGVVKSAEPRRMSLELDARAVDASAVVPSAPATRIDAKVSANLNGEGEGYRGKYELTLERPKIAQKELPTIDTQGTLAFAGSKMDVAGELGLADKGAKAQITYRAHNEPAGGHADVDARVELRDPPRLQALADVRTNGTLDVHAHASWPGTALSAEVDLALERATHGADRVGATRAHFVVRGPVSRASVDGSVAAAGIHVADRDFKSAKVRVSGTLDSAQVGVDVVGGRDERLSLSSNVGLKDGRVTLDQTKLAFHDERGRIDASVARALIAGERVDVDAFALHGAGDAEASLRMRGSALHVEAKTNELELTRLMAIAGVKTPVRTAFATLAVRLDQGRALDADVQGRIDRVSYAAVNGGKLAVVLGVRGNTVSGHLATELVPGSPLVVDLDQFVYGRLLAKNVELPEGQVAAKGKLDLTSMGSLFGSVKSLPFDKAKGTIDIDLRYGRASVEAVPELAGHVRTHDLEFVGKRDESSSIDSSGEAIAAAPTVYRGIDFGLDLGLDTASKRLTTHVGFYDNHGELLTVDAFAGPWPRGSLAELTAAAREVPLEVKAAMPARRLGTLPPPIRPLSVRGIVGGDLTFDGSLANPHAVLDVRASRLTAKAENIKGDVRPKVAVIGHVEYRRDRGKVALVADRKNERALDANVEWTGDIVGAASDKAALAGLDVSAEAVLHELDLETIPALKNRQIEGIVSGVTRVKYSANRRRVFADIVAHPLRVGQTTMDRLNVAVDAQPGSVRGAVSVSGRAGSLNASLRSGFTWPAAATPSLAGEIVGSLSARGFHLGGLWPVVSSSINELDGKLDADLSAHVRDGQVQLSGNGRLADGVVQIPSIGQRFEAISARIKVEPSAIVVDDLRARGLTGALTANARVEVDEHLGLRQLTAGVQIEKDHKLPVTVQGVAMGEAWGKVEAKLVKQPERMEITVRVPELHIDMPDTGGGGVQDLAPDPSIRIGMHRSDAAFVALPVQPLEQPAENPTPTGITIELGNIWLRKSDLVNAEVTGKIHVESAGKSTVTGEINLKGGTLDVSGKRFQIERGTVTFTGGDPSDPTIFAVARWDAPAGYAVYATYAGTVQKGNLTLSAEPPLSQEEIINLILFGTPEGSAGSGSSDTAASAVGLAGGTVAKGLNRAISDFTNLDVQARIDTSTGSARPEILVPISRKLSARVTYAVGEPSPGTSPDRTFLTLELRLKQNWVLSALFGDRGASALDLIWRKHY